MAHTLVGVVSSDKTDKTIVVTVTTRKTHPIYKKQYSVSTKFMAHDADNAAHIGDKVLLTSTRPMSARKRFKLEKVLETARITHVEPEATAAVTDEPAIVAEPVAEAKPKAAPKRAAKAKTEETK